MSPDFVCTHLTCWTWFNHLSSFSPPSWDLFLLPNAILLFLFSMKGILIIKYKLELVWERVLLEGLARKWRRTKKTILEAAHPSSLHATNRVLCAKSLLESLIMLFKLPNPSIPSFMILSHLRLLEECWERLVFTQQRRRKFLCSRWCIDNKGSSLPEIMRIGL